LPGFSLHRFRVAALKADNFVHARVLCNTALAEATGAFRRTLHGERAIRRLTQRVGQSILLAMNAVEFTTELGEQPVVTIPKEVAAQLPKSGQARIIILTAEEPEDAQWRSGAYEQFMRDDAPEDAVYDSYL